MSSDPTFTNEQKQLLEYCYHHPRTHAEVARHLRCDVEHIRSLTAFRDNAKYLYVDLNHAASYDEAPISLQHEGDVLVESLRAARADQRRLTRRFWIEVLLGGLLGWLLSAFGTPQQLFQAVRGLLHL